MKGKRNNGKGKHPSTVALRFKVAIPEHFDQIFQDEGIRETFDDSLENASAVVEETFKEFGVTEVGLDSVTHNVAAITDFFITRVKVKVPECKAGCNFCCHMRVTLTPVESIKIVRFLRKTLTPMQLVAIKEKIRRNRDLAERSTRDECTRAKVPCALLAEDAKCSIYSVRPLNCRRWLSYSRAKCEEALQTPDGKGVVPLDGHSFSWASGTSAALGMVLEKMGLESEEYELHSSLIRALDTVGVEEKWLRGERVFSGCKTHDK